jgi:chromosomal replication initiation ATPase DnaA
VPQLPLALRYPQDERLETFIGAPDGALAQLRAIAVGEDQHWVYLEGAAGTGKTHQALAMCSLAEQAGRQPTYLPLKAVVGRTRAALESLEGRDLVALDGLDAVAGNRDDEVALFDFHNRARSAGITLLYTAQHARTSWAWCCRTCARACSSACAWCCSRWMMKAARPCCVSARRGGGCRLMRPLLSGCSPAPGGSWAAW